MSARLPPRRRTVAARILLSYAAILLAFCVAAS